MIVYNKNNGRIMAYLDEKQDFDFCFQYYSKDVRDSWGKLETHNVPTNYLEHKVINNQIIQMTEQELIELVKYGEILTQEERLLNQLKPSYEEVQKAEQTIDILTLLQEVL